jgi:hypothetical protein
MAIKDILFCLQNLSNRKVRHILSAPPDKETASFFDFDKFIKLLSLLLKLV